MSYEYEDRHSLWVLRMAADSENGFVGEWRQLVDGIARFLGDEEARLASDPNKTRELEKVRWFWKYFAWATDRSWVNEIQAPFPR